MSEIRLDLPAKPEDIEKLRAGDRVFLNGEVFVARDAAHKRFFDAVNSGEELPIDIGNAAVYYMGPSPARDGRVIGSAGPTTSTRMDKYTPLLLSMGLKIMIGKGRRSPEVKKAMAENNAVYLAAIGGCGALLSKSIIGSQVICYEDLGTEAVRKITVRDFPCIVAADRFGNDLYERNGI